MSGESTDENALEVVVEDQVAQDENTEYQRVLDKVRGKFV
jgi:hypothetical protein